MRSGYHCPKCGIFTSKLGEQITTTDCSFYCPKCNLNFITVIQYCNSEAYNKILKKVKK
jgi:transcription initiation factor IIE alpha subunit